MPFKVWHREINRRQRLFVILRETRVKGMPHVSKTREEAFASLRHHCGVHDMVVLTVMRPGQ